MQAEVHDHAVAQHRERQLAADRLAPKHFVNRINRWRGVPVHRQDHIARAQARALARPAGNHLHHQHAGFMIEAEPAH